MLYWMIPCLICGLDLWIKNYVEHCVEMNSERPVCGGKFLLKRTHNTGAMLNFMERKKKVVTGFSAGLTAVLLIGYLCLLGKKGMGLLRLGLGLIIGGACSNVYDRIVRKYVVDYFSFNTKWKKFRAVVFNIGDIFIFLGAFLVILWNVRHKS